MINKPDLKLFDFGVSRHIWIDVLPTLRIEGPIPLFDQAWAVEVGWLTRAIRLTRRRRLYWRIGDTDMYGDRPVANPSQESRRQGDEL